MEILSSARRYLFRNEQKTPSDVLNGQLQYIRKYKERIGTEDVMAILNTKGFEFMAPYFGMKLFDGNTEAQIEMLSSMVNSLDKGEGYARAKEAVQGLLQSERYSIQEMSPNKLSRVALWGGSLIQKRAEEVAQDVSARGETPALIAYSGLFALKPFVEELKPHSHLYVMIPRESNNGETLGYSIARTSDDELSVDAIASSNLLSETSVAFIDDTMHSGNTLRSMVSVFPSASTRNATLFIS